MSDDYSALGASGFTFTRTELYNTASKIIKHSRHHFEESKIRANLWAYREQGYEHISCELFSDDNTKKYLSITICAGGETDFDHWDELTVVDMTEALHLIGIVLTAINASISCGKVNNEINESILSKPLTNYETNGKIDLNPI